MAWVFAANESELGDQVTGVIVEGQHIALYRLDGEVFATSNVCTHQFAILSDGFVEDGCIECPLHAAQFDIKTGNVISGPALTSIATYPVRREDGKLLIDL